MNINSILIKDNFIEIFKQLNHYELYICSNVCPKWRKIIIENKFKCKTYNFQWYTNCQPIFVQQLPKWFVENYDLPNLETLMDKILIPIKNVYDQSANHYSVEYIRYNLFEIYSFGMDKWNYIPKKYKFPQNSMLYFKHEWLKDRSYMINLLKISDDELNELSQHETRGFNVLDVEPTNVFCYSNHIRRNQIKVLWKKDKDKFEKDLYKNTYLIPFKFMEALNSLNDY